MILVTGSIFALEGHADELLALSVEHVQRSRTEPGCLEHGVYRDAENPLRLIFFERWEDRAALATHFGLQETRNFVADITPHLASPPELHIYGASKTQVP